MQDLSCLMFTSTTALPRLGQQKPASGKCLDRHGRKGDTTGMAFFPDSSNKFGFSIFNGDDHDIFLKITNARRGFCPLVIKNLKYGSQNMENSPSITCFTKPVGLLQIQARNYTHGLHEPLVYKQAHPLAAVSLG